MALNLTFLENSDKFIRLEEMNAKEKYSSIRELKRTRNRSELEREII